MSRLNRQQLAVAGAIRDTYKPNDGCVCAFRRLAEAVAQIYADTNPGFDYAGFLAECRDAEAERRTRGDSFARTLCVLAGLPAGGEHFELAKREVEFGLAERGER